MEIEKKNMLCNMEYGYSNSINKRIERFSRKHKEKNFAYM